MKTKATQMSSSAAAAEALLKAIANRHRLMILCQLTEAEHSVGDLAKFLQLRCSTVSQHLALLRKDGLVTARREAQTIWYSVASEPAQRLLETLYQIYCSPAAPCPAGGKPRPPAKNPLAKGKNSK
jgi:ArsR family transcriptional regulator, virulence genes transcriptional regulator